MRCSNPWLASTRAALQSSLERLAQADILFVEGDGAQANYRFKHALIQDAAYDSLLKSRRQALHARAAEILGESASPEPEAIAHHFTQAGLDDHAIEWWGKAGDQALRRSAFQEAISHLGKAIAMADKLGGGGVGAAPIGQRLKIQTNYARAIAWSRGYAADETKAAVARVQELVSGKDDIAERLNAHYVPIATKLVNGEVNQALTMALTFLRESVAEGGAPDVVAAHRMSGLVYLFLGALPDARMHLEEAIRIYDPDWNDATKCRHAVDSGITATAYLAHACWQFGEVARARELINQATAGADDLGHIPTLANMRFFKAMLGMFRDDGKSTLRDADALIEITTSNGLALYLIEGETYRAWARARLGDREAARAEMRHALAKRIEAGVRASMPYLLGKLAELDAECQSADEAAAHINEALAIAGETGERWTDALLHRIRGDILLKADPENPALAEEAYLAAITIARERGARSFGLRAALALAELCQSTGRPADAHAVLAPALEGFAPTPEMPEIAEAQTLLVALAETEEVKAAEARRNRRLHLQTAYGQAMMWSKGYNAEETKAAFAHAAELAGRTGDFSGRLTALHGQWAAALVGGELTSARNLAFALLRETESAGRAWEAGIANRMIGVTAYFHGDFVEARTRCERALEAPDTKPDPNVAQGISADSIVSSAYLAPTLWALGHVERARELINTATRRAAEIDVPAMADALHWKVDLEILRDDAIATLSAAESLEVVAQENDMAQWFHIAQLAAAWARGRINELADGAAQFRQALARLVDLGVRTHAGFFGGLLAELEVETLGAISGLARVDDAMRLATQTENRFALSFLHRIRGKILHRRNPADLASAEEAFQTAIAIAKEQGARSFDLQASLALAKLYQSIGRHTDAHAILAPALEGFSPTPEMPEIAEAWALLTALAATDEVKVEAAHRQRLTQLHVSYGNALIAARGYGAPETTEAFARARESTAGSKDAPGRLSADYGLWVGSFTRGELPAMRAHSADFLDDIQARPDSPEAGVAHRVAGATCWFAGEYREARDHLERALAMFQPGRDDDLAFRFGQDQGVSTMAYLALVLWPLGEIDRAASFMSRVLARMTSLRHGNTIALGHMFAAQFALMHSDPMRGKANSSELARIRQRPRSRPVPRLRNVFRWIGKGRERLARRDSTACVMASTAYAHRIS